MGVNSDCVFLQKLSLSWLAEIGRREGGTGKGQLLYTDKCVGEHLQKHVQLPGIEQSYKLFLLDCSVCKLPYFIPSTKAYKVTAKLQFLLKSVVLCLLLNKNYC